MASNNSASNYFCCINQNVEKESVKLKGDSNQCQTTDENLEKSPKDTTLPNKFSNCTVVMDNESDKDQDPLKDNNEGAPTKQKNVSKEWKSISKCYRSFKEFIKFKYLLVWSLVNLAILINKLYEDGNTASLYFKKKELDYFVVSAMCLALPTMMHSIYLVGKYFKEEKGCFRCRNFLTVLVHGIFLIPWQMKSHLDILQYLCPRVFKKKNKKKEEKEEGDEEEDEEEMHVTDLKNIQAKFDFFENFYAGLLQLILQLYVIIINLRNHTDRRTLIESIVASNLSLLVTLSAAIRRKDDGRRTFVLSLLGWCLIFTSKTIAMAMATTVIHYYMVAFCGMHILVISSWITHIALENHYENYAELRTKNKVGIFLMVLALFGLPSLWYWPFMFQLKQNKRVLKFLFIIFIENVILLILWGIFRGTEQWSFSEMIFAGFILGGSLLGIFLLLIYITCKPVWTDQLYIEGKTTLNSKVYGFFFIFFEETFLFPSVIKMRREEEWGIHECCS